MREGSLLPWRLELAAYAGDEAAFGALSLEQQERLIAHEWTHFRPTPDGLWAVLERAGRDAQLRVLVDALRRAFDNVANEPVVAGRLGEIRAILERCRTAEEMRVLQRIAEEERDTTFLGPREDLGSLIDTARALAEALERRGDLRAAYLAAVRATSLRDAFGSMVTALVPEAKWIDADLAAYVGAPGAREGKRAPHLLARDWAAGARRWGRVAAIWAMFASVGAGAEEKRDPGKVQALVREFQAWIVDPSHETYRYPNRMSIHPLGLPGEHSLGWVREILIKMTGSASHVPPEVQRELAAFALRGDPIFLFHGLGIEEELPPQQRGDAFRASLPGSTSDLRLLALRVRVPEARLLEITRPLGTLDHPNLARLVRVGFAGELAERGAFLVYERALGLPLEDWLAGERSLDERRAVVRGILDGLEHAHALGVVHGSLGSQSVLVDGGAPLIIDHGHAAVGELERRDFESGDHVYRVGMGIDPSYSPEKLGDGFKGVSTDIYGAGALAARILTGEPPFRGSGAKLATRILKDRPGPFGYRDPVLQRALAKIPVDRFPSIAALRDALLG